MPRPSIAILGSRGIPAQYGGFETFTQELAVRLAKQGIDVTVYCEGSTGPTMYHGVRLVYVPAPHLGGLTTILHDFRALWAARKKYDIVYMLGYGTSLFCLMPRLAGTEVWMNMDGIEWQRGKWGIVGKTWWKLMESVANFVPHLMIADAEAIKAFLGTRHDRLPKIVVIPYGADIVESPPDTAPLAEWGLEPDGYHLVVSRFEPENHVRELFLGYTNSNSPHPLIALGTTRKPTAYTRALDAIATADSRIILPGPIYDERLVALRYYARTYLHGHSVGGTNPSLLEAMASGNAIVAHDNPFNREVAKDCAVYFSTAADVTAQVERLDADENQRNAVGSRALERVRASYTWDRVVEAYLKLLTVPVAIPSDDTAVKAKLAAVGRKHKSNGASVVSEGSRLGVANEKPANQIL